MDTSPDCSGKDVKPQLVSNYRGGDIVLPGDPTQVIRASEHRALAPRGAVAELLARARRK